MKKRLKIKRIGTEMKKKNMWEIIIERLNKNKKTGIKRIKTKWEIRNQKKDDWNKKKSKKSKK